MKYNIHPTCQIPADILNTLYSTYFDASKQNSFVEVGAYDGIEYSNTNCLADVGWIGLYIEADPSVAEVCAENHKHNTLVSVCSSAVGNYAGKCKLYKSKVNGDSVSSTLLEKTNIDWGCREDNYKEVQIDTLDSILNRFNWNYQNGLLVIDVEEAELAVLYGYSIEKYKPKMVIIEINEREDDFSKIKKVDVYKYFAERYDVVYADHINTIFVRKT